MSKFSFPATDGAGTFSVPACVVDFHMADAKGDTLAALLYILRHNEGFEPERAIAELALSPEQFERAVEFWLARGVLACKNGAVMLNPACLTVSTRGGEVEKRVRPEYEFEEICASIEKNKALSALIAAIQPRFSKPLGAASLKSVYMFYDYYGFSPELIFQLVAYCTGLGHDNFKYIEQVALEWYSLGITTEERAGAYIAQRERKRSAEYAVCRIFGIEGRNLTKKEKALVVKWTDTLGFGEDMLEAAFERGVNGAKKLSFTYIDRILEKWASEGIKTPAQADAADELFELSRQKSSAKGGKAPVRGEKTYDVDDFADWSYSTMYADKEEEK